MLGVYRILINLIFVLSPLIILVRLIKKKKNYLDLKRNFVFFLKEG